MYVNPWNTYFVVGLKFDLVSEGPAHNITFTAKLVYEGQEYAAQGISKKTAKQNVAASILRWDQANDVEVVWLYSVYSLHTMNVTKLLTRWSVFYTLFTF